MKIILEFACYLCGCYDCILNSNFAAIFSKSNSVFPELIIQKKLNKLLTVFKICLKSLLTSP